MGTQRGPVSVYFSPGKDPEYNIRGFIEECTKTIDIAMFSMSSAFICAKVFEADRRDVAVRIVFDSAQGVAGYSAWTKWIKAYPGNIKVKFKGKPGLMHNKFCIGDGVAVISGSYNWTEAARNINRENLLIIRSQEIVNLYKNEFDIIWGASRKLE